MKDEMYFRAKLREFGISLTPDSTVTNFQYLSVSNLHSLVEAVKNRLLTRTDVKLHSLGESKQKLTQ